MRPKQSPPLTTEDNLSTNGRPVRAAIDRFEYILIQGFCLALRSKNPAGEDVRENVTVSSREEVGLFGSRGSAHFAIKWARDAKQQASLQVRVLLCSA